MASERGLIPRVNWFDGMRVTESDLDAEQIHDQNERSYLVSDFHGSGAVNNLPFAGRILLDTSNPGKYVESGQENSSKSLIEAGEYDGTAVLLDKQPSDTVRGNRLEVEISDVDILGRVKTKVLILGKAFDGVNDFRFG